MLVDEMGVEFRFDKGRMGQESLKERDGRFDAADLVFVQGPAHSMDGLVTIFSMGDDLGDDRVVFHGNLRLSADSAVVADTGSGGFKVGGDGAG